MLLPLLLVVAGTVGDVGAPPTDAAAAPPSTRTRVLVLDVGGDLPASQKTTLTHLIVARLSRFAALEVVGQQNVEKLLGIEAEKQLAGCDGDEDACLAELAGAFNAELVAVPQAGKIGGTTVFTLQLVDRKGATVGRGSAQVSGFDELAPKISDVVDAVGREFTGSEPGDGSSSSSSPVSSSSSETAAGPAAVPAGVTGPLLIGGGVGLGVGVALMGLGAVPAILAGNGESDLTALRIDYVKGGRDDDALQRAATRQQEIDDARGLWNDVGIYAFWGGFVVAAAGGGALAASLLLDEAP